MIYPLHYLCNLLEELRVTGASITVSEKYIQFLISFQYKNVEKIFLLKPHTIQFHLPHLLESV